MDSLFGAVLASAGHDNGVGLLTLFGRMHPALIHFPIALIVFALVAEVVSLFWKKPEIRWTALVVLVSAAVTAIPAALAGWTLSRDMLFSGRMAEIMTMHIWAGTSVAVAVWPLVFLRKWLDKHPSRNGRIIYLAALGILVAAIALTGHLGGSLVYGPDFLPGWP